MLSWVSGSPFLHGSGCGNFSGHRVHNQNKLLCNKKAVGGQWTQFLRGWGGDKGHPLYLTMVKAKGELLWIVLREQFINLRLLF